MLRVVQGVLPLLATGSVIVNVSSVLGSLSGMGAGHTFYAPAKTLQNALTRQLAADLASEGIIVMAVHPGWARTAIGGPGATVDPAASARGIADLLFSATAEDSGSYRDFEGNTIPW
jgi:NAD(P)-dependent dehydrogenase (short-subunit alcohol dehydrogenase family)